MSSSSKRIIIPAIAFLFILASGSFGADNSPDQSINESRPSETSGISFFPQVGLQLDCRAFKDNKADYTAQSSRIIDLDIFRKGNILFSMFVNEYICYDDNSRYINPKTINYEMDYGKLSREFRYGILSIFMDHICTNIYNENHTEDRQMRWYGFGIRWESYGLRPGQKELKNNSDNANDINIFNNLKYKISIDRRIRTKVMNYDYLITGSIRYDILHYYFLIPYIEGEFRSLIDERARYNRYFETGIRMHFDRGDLTPFIGINRKYDIEYYNRHAVDMYYIGLRAETLLATGSDRTGRESGSRTGKPFIFPDFRFSGSYGKYLADNNLNFNTDILIGLDWSRAYKTSPFISNTLVHNSQKASAGMFPRYIENTTEAGIAHRLDLLNAFIEPYYTYARYDKGNYDYGHKMNYSAAGLRIISSEMKTGYAGNSVDFDSPAVYNFMNRIDWLISASGIINNSYYKYDWEYNVKLRWNLCRYYRSVPYITAGIRLLHNNNFDAVYSAEPGIRIQNGLYWMLFYRFEYRTDTDPDNGYFRNYHLTGIRLEI
ncbi:MAG: hypothetical protein V1874_06205 [Spirochaetota bacterium]